MSQFYKTFLFRLVVSAILIGAMGTGIVLFARTISVQGATIFKNREEFLSRSHRLQEFAFLKSQYDEKGSKYLAMMRQLIPVRDDLINLQQEFKFLSDQMGLRSSLQFTGETAPDADGVGVLKFTLTVSGTPTKLFSFVERLSAFRYLNRIEGVSFNQGSSPGKSEMQIKGAVFFRKNT